MNARDVITAAVLQRFPGAAVVVDWSAAGYRVAAAAAAFDGLTRADAEAALYDALQRLPLTLVARITELRAAGTGHGATTVKKKRRND